MRKVISKSKVLKLFICLIFVFLTGCASKTSSVVQHDTSYDLEKLYKDSIIDSIIIDKDELMPVAVLTPESDNVTWDSVHNKYFVMSFHQEPSSYPAGREVVLSSDSVWVFCDKEIKKWYQENSLGVTDWNMRMLQLLGLPPTSAYTHVSGFWVSPSDIIRPAYVSDITKSEMTDSFDGTVDPTYHKWFNDNIIGSYFEGAYPWTRIGYTYDWAPNGKEKGLSEFLIKQGSSVHVDFTEPLEQFISRIK